MSQDNRIGESLRTSVGKLLRSEGFKGDSSEWSGFTPGKVVNYLFPFLYSMDDLIKWRAVTAMGHVVAKMAEENMESARNIMRRLIWNLNDESGGIGWGSAEAMGEIMASNQIIAEEFAPILISYIRQDCNPIENELLERGVLWGLGRLSQVRPHLLQNHVSHILTYLKSVDPVLRGHALWILENLRDDAGLSGLQALLIDKAEIQIFQNGTLNQYRICDLAARILAPPG